MARTAGAGGPNFKGLGQVINVVGPGNREVYESLTPAGGPPHACQMSMPGMAASESQVKP